MRFSFPVDTRYWIYGCDNRVKFFFCGEMIQTILKIGKDSRLSLTQASWAQRSSNFPSFALRFKGQRSKAELDIKVRKWVPNRYETCGAHLEVTL